jgi:acetyl coenzyme A synthetase (ADP forming)-like protein
MPHSDLTNYTADVVLRDGSTVQIRSIRPDETSALRSFYQRLSPDSRYQRFFATVALDTANPAVLEDKPNRVTLVADAGALLIGVGQYDPIPGASGRAEVAFAIADTRQGRGIGTRLLERLAVIARAQGIDEFEAYVLADNRQMRQVFSESGFDQRWDRLDGNTAHVVLSLKETPIFHQKAAARSRLAATASLTPFFHPTRVAVVGASHQRGRIGAEIFHNIRQSGFTGQVIPVNSRSSIVEGIPCVPRVGAIDGPVDLAVIAVPCRSVEEVIDDCIAKDVKALIVISAGFAETGGAGRALEASIVEKVRAAGIRMIGPNCMGLMNTDPAVRLNATFSPVTPPEGRLALSTQSGALGLAIIDYAKKLRIGFSTFVSIGNKADVSGNDLIQYWAEDPRTDAILLYLESFGNPRKFGELAREVAARKPIIAVKAGRSSVGAKAASSHTGALASSDAVVDALFKQAGVIRTYTLEELFDVAAFVAHQPVPAGRRVAVLTNAGGPAILAADACEANGLELPALSERTRHGLHGFLPAAASISNPIDMLASAPADHYSRALELLQQDDAIDSILTIFIPPLVTEPEAVATAIRDATVKGKKPVLATFMSAHGAPEALGAIPCYMFPEAAVTALARVAAYGEWRCKPRGQVPQFAEFRQDAARAIVERVLALGGGWLPPRDADELLATCGIDTAAAITATNEEDVVAAARAIGGPVAMKAVGPSILHKSEVGGVKLGLEGDSAVRDAYREMSARLGDRVSHVLIQEMVPNGVEMIVGVTQDPSFGPIVACGTGGTLVELFADVVFRMPPLTDVDAADMVNELKGAARLRGYRGAAPVDEDALKDTLLRVSALVECCPEIHELDINPLAVLPRGVCALDVRIRVEWQRRALSRRIQY